MWCWSVLVFMASWGKQTFQHEVGACWGEEKEFISLLSQHWQNRRRCKIAYAHYHGDQSIRSLIRPLWGVGTTTQVQLRPSWRGSSILPSLSVSSYFNIFWLLPACVLPQGFTVSMAAPPVLLVCSSVPAGSLLNRLSSLSLPSFWLEVLSIMAVWFFSSSSIFLSTFPPAGNRPLAVLAVVWETTFPSMSN